MRTVSIIVLFVGLSGACAAQQSQAPSGGSPGVVLASSQASSKPPSKKAKASKSGKAAAAQGATQGPDDTQNPPTKEKLFPRKLPPRSSVLAEAGWADWNLTGNQAKFRQYGTLPRGLFLRDFRFAPEFKNPTLGAYFEVKDVGQDDYRAETRLASSYGNTLASGFLSQAKFFDPTVGAVDLSARKVNGAYLRQFLSRDFSVSARFRDDTQEKYFAAPDLPFDQNTRNWDITAGGKVSHGFATVSFGELDFNDYTATLVNTTTQSTEFRYMAPMGPNADAEAGFTHVSISQPDRAVAHVDTLALNSDMNLGPRTDLELMFQNRQIGMPVVQDAFIRQQAVTGLRLHQRWKDWRAQAGFKYQQDQRVNGDHTYVDTPHWNTMDASLSGRLSPEIKLTVRGSSRNLVGAPPAVTDDPTTLYWDNRAFEQARLEGNWTNFNSYVTYTFQNISNVQRTSQVATRQVTIGGVWQISPLLNLFAEYDHENWSGHTDATGFGDLQDFLPNSDTGVVELTWNLRSRVFLALSYTGFASSSANPLLLQDANTSGNFLTITGRYRFPAGYEAGVIVAPWTYRDNVVSAMNYTAAVVMFTGSARY